MHCKICFCDDHVQSKITAFQKGKGYDCKKCLKPLSETKLLSVSARSISFGRLAYDDAHRGEDDDDEDGAGGGGGSYSYMDAYGDEDDVEEGFSNIKLGDYDDDYYNEEDEEGEDDDDDDDEDDDDEEGDDDEDDE
jgi:hypothetical protein